MKKILFSLLCLSWIGTSFAEEVKIAMVEGYKEGGIYVAPWFFFLNDEARLFWADYNALIYSGDVEVYDFNLNSSTIHFNCDRIFADAYISDARYAQFDYPFLFTQCFFNNDDLYECITCDTETSGTEEGQSVYSQYVNSPSASLTGGGYLSEDVYNLRVINQNGDVLYTFEAPEGYKYFRGVSFTKLSYDDVILAQIYYYKGYEGQCYCYYTLKAGETSSMATIKHKQEMKFNVNPITKGADLVVTVGEGVQKSSIKVTSISGMTVKDVPVVDGKAVIATSDMERGLYIASQKGGGSAKFIVK